MEEVEVLDEGDGRGSGKGSHGLGFYFLTFEMYLHCL